MYEVISRCLPPVLNRQTLVLVQGMRTEAQMAKQAALMQRQQAVLRRKLQEADASRKRLVGLPCQCLFLMAGCRPDLQPGHLVPAPVLLCPDKLQESANHASAAALCFPPGPLAHRSCVNWSGSALHGVGCGSPQPAQGPSNLAGQAKGGCTSTFLRWDRINKQDCVCHMSTAQNQFGFHDRCERTQ